MRARHETAALEDFKRAQQFYAEAVARYPLHLRGAWRWIYVVSAVSALWFNVFVLIVQSFQKIPALKALAPHQNEAPFVVTQLVALVLFILLAIRATARFRLEPVRTV